MSKPYKKSNEELLKLGQGERLKLFRVGKGFKSRLPFSEKLNISNTSISDIEKNKRELSDNLLAIIKDKFPDADVEWLKTGNSKKLLTTEKLNSEVENVLNESHSEFKRDEKFLISELQKVIIQQRETISQLLKQIEILQNLK